MVRGNDIIKITQGDKILCLLSGDVVRKKFRSRDILRNPEKSLTIDCAALRKAAQFGGKTVEFTVCYANETKRYTAPVDLILAKNLTVDLGVGLQYRYPLSDFVETTVVPKTKKSTKVVKEMPPLPTMQLGLFPSVYERCLFGGRSS